jgi:hypothetical protein
VTPDKKIGIEIDKLTRSIEDAISGISFTTAILPLTQNDVQQVKNSKWIFDWKSEIANDHRSVSKLVIVDDPAIIQGLISLQDKHDHVYMHLIESSKSNRGAKKAYLGVPGNLIAFACKLSFELGYEGFVSFESKTALLQHYKNTLGATVLFSNIMVIETRAAIKLVNQYFPIIL